ncbi:MAG TPA: hypothetical protein VHC96_08295 [Puia sp.]|nr:hypothetical protein [Puia sp.]
MRSFCIRLPLLTLFSLSALSCPREVPATPAMPLHPARPARCIQPADMLPARAFPALPRTEISLRDNRVARWHC